jgi:uncharacterized protein YeeX (DUF496 family)
MRKKLKNNCQDLRILLNQNLSSLEKDPTKIRNVAIILALMKQDNVNIDPFVPQIHRIF